MRFMIPCKVRVVDPFEDVLELGETGTMIGIHVEGGYTYAIITWDNPVTRNCATPDGWCVGRFEPVEGE